MPLEGIAEERNGTHLADDGDPASTLYNFTELRQPGSDPAIVRAD
jgi:hypothetical protein